MIGKKSTAAYRVIPPEAEATEPGGVSGHEQCRWRLDLGGTTIGCAKSALHHLSAHPGRTDHWDGHTELGWDAEGRIWQT